MSTRYVADQLARALNYLEDGQMCLAEDAARRAHDVLLDLADVERTARVNAARDKVDAARRASPISH